MAGRRRLSGKAAVILGPQGPTFTNLVAWQPGTHVVELKGRRDADLAFPGDLPRRRKMKHALVRYAADFVRNQRFRMLYRRAVAFNPARHVADEPCEILEVLAGARAVTSEERHVVAGLRRRFTLPATWPELAVSRRREVLFHANGALTDGRGRLFAETTVWGRSTFDWRRRRAGLSQIADGGPAIARAFVVTGDFCDNYYHWMIEMVSRLALARDFVRRSGVPVVVAARQAFHAESLARLFPEIEFVRWNGVQPLRVRECVYVPPSGQSCVPDPRLVTELRRVAGVGARPAGRGAAIWIERRTKMRTLEPASRDFGERVARLGLVSVEPEKLSFARQLELFSSARVVASVHGAGLTNLVWMAPGGRVVEVGSALFGEACYALLAARSGLGYDCILSDQRWCWLGSIAYGGALQVRLAREDQERALGRLADAVAAAD